MNDRITFSLKRGFIDENGIAHKDVVLRAPSVDDQIKADRQAAQRRESMTPELAAEGLSDTMWEVFLLAEAMVSLGSIMQVTELHLRKLCRLDFRLLRAKLEQLELSLVAGEEPKPDPNSASGESTSSDSPESAASPPAS